MQNVEFNTKLSRVREMMNSRTIPAVLINNQSNFSWLKGGRGFIGIASEKSCCSVLITREKVYFITNNIEGGRLKEEELDGLDGEFIVFPWYNEEVKADRIKVIMQEEQLVNDDTLALEFRQMRSVMTEDELRKGRWLGLSAARVTENAARSIKPGCTEFETWGLLAHGALDHGVEPATILVAFDERIFD